MMDMGEIIVRIGEDKYHEACSASRKAAARTGMSPGKCDFESEIPHDVCELVWGSPANSEDKLELAFRFNEEMPCYAYLMYISINFREFSAATKAFLWKKYKTYLSGEDTLAEPVAYSLWCDFFEDDTRVRETWNALTSDISNEPILRRVLVSSGPVPFAEKEKLYQHLLPHPKWHYYIFRSLLHSRFDVYGNMDRIKAKRLLGQLVLPSDTENLAMLKDALQ